MSGRSRARGHEVVPAVDEPCRAQAFERNQHVAWEADLAGDLVVRERPGVREQVVNEDHAIELRGFLEPLWDTLGVHGKGPFLLVQGLGRVAARPRPRLDLQLSRSAIHRDKRSSYALL